MITVYAQRRGDRGRPCSVTVQSCYLIAEDADVRQVTVKLAKIQAVAYYESVRDLEASEGNRNSNDSAGFLVQERAYADAARLAGLQVAEKVARGHSGIYNPFNKQYVPAFNYTVEIFCNARRPAGPVHAPVTHQANEIHLQRNLDLFYQIGHEQYTSLEHSHQQRQTILIGGGNFSAHFDNAPLNRLLRDQNLYIVIGLRIHW